MSSWLRHWLASERLSCLLKRAAMTATTTGTANVPSAVSVAASVARSILEGLLRRAGSGGSVEEEVGGSTGHGDGLDREALMQATEAVPQSYARSEQDRHDDD